MLSRRNLLMAAPLLMAAGLFAVPARAQSADAARAFIARLADQAIAIAAAKNTSPVEQEKRFRELFVIAFDLPEISKFVLGRHWRTASEQQRQQFLALFEELTVLTWAKRFRDYSGETFVTGEARPDGEGRAIVESQVNRRSAPPIPVIWRVASGGAGWKITDIVVEGVSMAITYRSDYTAAMNASGGKIDGLLEQMRAKVADLRSRA